MHSEERLFSLMTRKILITGAAGFIGFHLAKRFLEQGCAVLGCDGMTPYYDRKLKEKRLELLEGYSQFSFHEGMIEDRGVVSKLVSSFGPDLIVHLAAQAGVRYSIDEPRSYVSSNLVGTHEVLEAARACPPAHLMMASTSSSYGSNKDLPYAETDKAVHPMSFYAATKLANETMAHSYAHLFKVPTTMFRFFTVYGPFGRPDMALFKFTRAILAGESIDVYNYGKMMRDFTYIDDLIEGIVRVSTIVPGNSPICENDSLSPSAPFRVVNIGNGKPKKLEEFISAIEAATGLKAQKNYLPMQPGDVRATWADSTLLENLVGVLPKTDIKAGVQEFVNWYQQWAKLTDGS